MITIPKSARAHFSTSSRFDGIWGARLFAIPPCWDPPQCALTGSSPGCACAHCPGYENE